ncbi:MAG: hypothetical protein M1825_002690 [Sarcosagium campestre]|nr:MAG: hypothetical protein M1825_002690 [Sarcosagium campestre]
MSHDQNHIHESKSPGKAEAQPNNNNNNDEIPPTTRSRIRSVFSIPAPVKRLFDRFPLITYPPNLLPVRSPPPTNLPNLYIFSNPEDALHGRPSFNPSCLKWQTYLALHGVRVTTISSTNHSSPTGSLPFLLPARKGSLDNPSPVSGPSLPSHINAKSDPTPINAAHLSLLTHRIRPAFLHSLYLQPTCADAESAVERLYIQPATSSTVVRASLLHSLGAAAVAELVRQRRPGPYAPIDVSRLYADADDAWRALAVLLADGDTTAGSEDDSTRWFYGAHSPGMLDIEVFAYTSLVLDEARFGSDLRRLRHSLLQHTVLVNHSRRMMSRCFGDIQTSVS